MNPAHNTNKQKKQFQIPSFSVWKETELKEENTKNFKELNFNSIKNIYSREQNIFSDEWVT